MLTLLTSTSTKIKESTISKRTKFPDSRYYSMTKGDLIKMCAQLGIEINGLTGETKEIIIMRIREQRG